MKGTEGGCAGEERKRGRGMKEKEGEGWRREEFWLHLENATFLSHLHVRARARVCVRYACDVAFSPPCV